MKKPGNFIHKHIYSNDLQRLYELYLLARFHGDSATSPPLQSDEARSPDFSLPRIKTFSEGVGVDVFPALGSSFDCACTSVVCRSEWAYRGATDDAGRRESAARNRELAGCRMETDERRRHTAAPGVGAAERPRQTAEGQAFPASRRPMLQKSNHKTASAAWTRVRTPFQSLKQDPPDCLHDIFP